MVSTPRLRPLPPMGVLGQSVDIVQRIRFTAAASAAAAAAAAAALVGIIIIITEHCKRYSVQDWKNQGWG
jgi:hypothetical protein